MLATTTERACMYTCMAIYLAYQATKLAVGLGALVLSQPNPAWLNRLTRRR